MSFTASLDDIVQDNRNGLLGAAPGWPRVRLRDVATVLNGFAFPSENFRNEGGLPLVRIRDVVPGVPSGTTYVGEYDPRWLVSDGDLLVGMDGDFNCAFWRGGPALLNQRVCRVTAGPAFDQRFLAHLLPGYLKAINEHTSSVTVKHLSSRTLEDIPLPAPPLGEQRRLARILDDIVARSRGARAFLADTPALLDQLRQSVLAAAFRGDLTAAWREAHPDVQPAAVLLERIRTERRRRWAATNPKKKYEPPSRLDAEAEGLPDLPAGWEWVRLEEVAEVTGGLTRHEAKRASSEIQVPLVSVAAVQYRRIDTAAIGRIGLLDADGDKATLLPGDLLVVEGNGSLAHIGRVALWDGETEGARHQNHIIRVRSADVGTAFLLEWLSSPGGREQIIKKATSATGLYNLSLSKVSDLPVPLPPASEQQAVVEALRALHPLTNRVESEVAQMTQDIDAVERATLERAFRGELCAQDPDDEPVEQLLARLSGTEKKESERPRRGRPSGGGGGRMKEKPRSQEDRVLATIEAMPDGGLTFPEFRDAVGGDYESLRAHIFSLLEGETPRLTQRFDAATAQMRLCRSTP